MPTNYTPNYRLNQWERADKVLMEDFNADNAKIDAALKAEADVRASAVASLTGQLAGKGNCRIYTTTYTGTGTYGANNPNTLRFPGTPLLVGVFDVRNGIYYILGHGVQSSIAMSSGQHFCNVSWSGSSVSLTGIQHSGMNMNESGKTYQVIALISMS